MLQKNIFFLLLISMIGVLIISLLKKNEISIIQSDGKGYYAYLPALVIHQEKDFSKTNNSERFYYGDNYEPSYLNITEKGENYTKYFPGVALLQSPFFVGAIITSYISNSPIDGYSNTFQLFFFLGGLTYAIFGLYFFQKSLSIYFSENKKTVQLTTLFVYFSTPILAYSLDLMSYSHIYSFFLFGAFSVTILTRKNNVSFYLKLGIILGLIFLVRPTNVIVVFIIPFLLKTKPNTLLFFREMFADKWKNFWIAFFPFLAIVSIQFFLWKWQTGEWFVQSYQGEGFDFLQPQIWNNLFSFRIGLFVHTPIMILSYVGVMFLFKENRFATNAWFFYFFINTWIISSWWCWDYESYFGNRPFTEHLFFLLFPLVLFIKKRPKIGWSLLVLCSFVGFLRFYQFREEIITPQRFTSSSYFNSLFYFQNDHRFQFTQSCQPIGSMKKEMIVFNQTDSILIQPTDLFSLGSTTILSEENKGSMYYFRIELDKKIEEIPFNDVLLSIEANDLDSKKRFYHTFQLYNDKKEGQNEWKHLVFEQRLNDFEKEFDEFKIYIWNKGEKAFEVKNAHYSITSF